VGNIYNMIEKTGKKEGILFLDEINCVSETLAPIMLQFLQYKVFGNHPIPKGYVVVTAGNPPQYNKSAKEYDIATLDRLKLIKVTDNFEVWRDYASSSGVHESILLYLNNKPHHLNIVTKKIDGKDFVTPRSWEDFSRLLKVYETKGFNITKEIIAQYIQSEVITNEFYAFYKLFLLQKEKLDMKLLLDGDKSELSKVNSNMSFEDKIIITSIMFSNLKGDIINLMLEFDIYNKLKKLLSTKVTSEDGLLNITAEINKVKAERDKELMSNNLVESKRYEYNLLFDRFD
ncbi:MAG: ATPase, partial [bacterium]